MKRLIQILLLIAFAGLGIFFGHLNPQHVQVDYFFFQTDLPLAISHMLFFMAGLLIAGIVVYLGTWWRLRKRWKAQLKAQQKAAEQSSKELVVTAPSSVGNDPQA